MFSSYHQTLDIHQHRISTHEHTCPMKHSCICTCTLPHTQEHTCALVAHPVGSAQSSTLGDREPLCGICAGICTPAGVDGAAGHSGRRRRPGGLQDPAGPRLPHPHSSPVVCTVFHTQVGPYTPVQLARSPACLGTGAPPRTTSLRDDITGHF